jgi:hypothetical protein
VLQVDVTKTETQVDAVFYLNKDKDKKITLQMVVTRFVRVEG